MALPFSCDTIKKSLIFLIIISNFKYILCSNACVKPEITFVQKIEHKGFHREIRWLFERVPHKTCANSACEWAIQLKIPKELYLDPDQIVELNLAQKFSIFIDGKVNTEAVAHVATEHTAYIFVNDSISILINIPIHLRYQRAQIAGDFSTALLNKPSILVTNCPDICGKNDVIAPCNVEGIEICNWKNVTYQALFDDVELLVPVGNLDDYPLVSIVTILLGCAGCIYTLSVLSTVPL